MENNHFIYGKKRSDFFINEAELQFIKNHNFAQIMENKDKKEKLVAIFKKIASLSIVQKDIYNILNGFQLPEAKTTNQYNDFILKFIQNQEIKNNFRENGTIGNSIFILYLLLNNIIKYVQQKKIHFQNNINSKNVNKINQVYKEIRYLIKKFLKFREKIYMISQLKYIEAPIVKNTIIRPYFYYYHFYRPLIEEYIINNNDFIYNYENVRKHLLFRQEAFFYKVNRNNNSNNNSNNTKYKKFNIKKLIQNLNVSNNMSIKYNIENVNKLNEINIYNLYSIYYIKENRNNSSTIHTIISKRNHYFYKYEYKINENKVIVSKNPEFIYINEENLKQFLEKESSTYGRLQKVFSLFN